MRLAYIVVFPLLLPIQALAHAQLRGTDPAEGAVVAEAPTAVTLEFNEPVSPLVLRLIEPDGTTTDIDGAAENETVTAITPNELSQGTHLLSWRVMSDDGHPLGGTLTFHVGAPSSAPLIKTERATGVAQVGVALRFALTIALIIAVGAAVFTAFVTRGPTDHNYHRIVMRAALATLPVGALLIGVHGLDMLSLATPALLSLQPWQAGLSAPITQTVLLSIGATAVAALTLQTDKKPIRIALALAAWALASLSFAASGHAAVAPPRAIALPAVILHAVALIFWMGALLPLLLTLRGREAETHLRQFSSIAVPMVALLIVTGVTLGWLQFGSFEALTKSAYGAVLAVKLVLVAGLLALAAKNRFVLTPALTAEKPDAAPRLSRAIRTEIILGLAILALASAFRLTVPPRALVTPAEPLYAHIHTDRATAAIRLTPGHAGPVDIILDLQAGESTALVPQGVNIAFTHPRGGIEPIRLDALLGNDGLWHAGPVTLPIPGAWEVTLRLLITDFERVTLQDTLNLPE